MQPLLKKVVTAVLLRDHKGANPVLRSGTRRVDPDLKGRHLLKRVGQRMTYPCRLGQDLQGHAPVATCSPEGSFFVQGGEPHGNLPAPV